MKNNLFLILITLLVSCSKGEEPTPVNNPYLKITAKDFIGTWIYKVDNEDYAKIIITESGTGLKFEHSYNYATGWEEDKNEYFKQEGVKFFPYLTTTVNNKPHIVINSFHGTSRIDYVSDNKGTYLHLGVTGRYFKQ